MAEEDINAIIVYLRSGDPAVSAADTTVGLSHFTFIGKAYMNLHADPLHTSQMLNCRRGPTRLPWVTI